MTDEMTQDIINYLKSQDKSLTFWQRVQDAEAEMNTTYDMNPNDESHCKIVIYEELHRIVKEEKTVEDLHRFCGCLKHLKYWNKVRGYVEIEQI